MGKRIRRRSNRICWCSVGRETHQAIGHQAGVLGYRVRYTNSAGLLEELRASLADQTLPSCLREYARVDLLIVDEFGFDRLERLESPQAASLLYKVIDARSQQRSTALVSNIDFGESGTWATYRWRLLDWSTAQSSEAHRQVLPSAPRPEQTTTSITWPLSTASFDATSRGGDSQSLPTTRPPCSPRAIAP